MVLKQALIGRPRALDVPAAQCVQRSLAVDAGPLLGDVDVEGDVNEPGRSQIRQQLAGCLDAVRHQARPQPAADQPRHDGQQFVAPAQRGLAPRHLHIRARAVVRDGAVDAAANLLEREIAYRLGRLAQTAQRAVQVAALRHFQQHAGHRPAPARRLVRRPLAHALLPLFRVGQGVGRRCRQGFERARLVRGWRVGVGHATAVVGQAGILARRCNTDITAP